MTSGEPVVTNLRAFYFLHIHYAVIRDEQGIRYMNCGDWVESCIRKSGPDCLEFAVKHTWEASARAFIAHMAVIYCFGPRSDIAPVVSEQPRFVA